MSGTTSGASAACPTNVDPFDSRLDDPLERERLRRVFSQRLDAVIGHVLPLSKPAAGRRAGRRGPWFLRDERCYLIPGDSPMGYRLPLDSQPWVKPTDYPWVHAPDPSQQFPPLPAYRVLQQARAGASGECPRRSAQGPAMPLRKATATRRCAREVRSARSIARTALCAQPRDGRLHLFMPPTSALEDYLELVAAIEATAKAQSVPVVIEGYEPPRDPRLQVLRVTPDPGVIEVNVHPVSSWNELTEQTEFVYDAAHHTRLSSEKFQLDGRHSGTGGGNHFVLGGATPGDSPFLRRPDLLASMIGYWHNHPSLSYLFSGLFIGPTSQAPRVDEARNDATHELELALKEMKRMQGLGWLKDAPWQVDRALRNVLVDITGNTHRAEFCIDKMFTPEGGAGRLGLLELRAFEMPPHARMSLAQQLLLRGLIAHFWKKPYQPKKLQRWGTELHDRFMLPHFVQDDFKDVLTDLGSSGFEMPPRMVRTALRVPLPQARRLRHPQCRRGAAHGAGALACAGRAGRARRHRALRGFLAGAHAGEGARHGGCAACAHLQWPAAAAASHRHRR